MSKGHADSVDGKNLFDLYPQRNFRIVDQVKKDRIKQFLKNIELSHRKTSFFNENNLDFVPFVMERDGLGRLNKKSNVF